MIRLLALGSLIGLSGCLSTPDLTALANDPSAICIRLTSIYGSVETSRNHGCELSATATAKP